MPLCSVKKLTALTVATLIILTSILSLVNFTMTKLYPDDSDVDEAAVTLPVSSTETTLNFVAFE